MCLKNFDYKTIIASFRNINASLTHCKLMDSSFWFDIINLGYSIVHIKG